MYIWLINWRLSLNHNYIEFQSLTPQKYSTSILTNSIEINLDLNAMHVMMLSSYLFSAAPSTPIISGYTTGQVIRASDTLRLICESRGGNPLAQVVWFKNGQKIDFSYNSGNGRSRNEFQFSVERSDNGAVFRCEASNAATQTPKTAEVELKVYCEYLVSFVLG